MTKQLFGSLVACSLVYYAVVISVLPRKIINSLEKRKPEYVKTIQIKFYDLRRIFLMSQIAAIVLFVVFNRVVPEITGVSFVVSLFVVVGSQGVRQALGHVCDHFN